LVRRAESEGPQTVTVRGREAAVVLSAEQYKKLQPPENGRLPLVDFLGSLDLDGLDLARARDLGRDVTL
jgi:antitoxin Phd